MDSVIRAAVLYAFLMLVFRIAGRRTLGSLTSFDLVLVLVISETTQEALIDSDHSFINSVLLVITFLFMNVMLSVIKQRSPRFERWLDGTALVIVEHGRPNREYLTKARVDEEDILEAARSSQGLERMEQIKFAVLERDGTISIIPAEKA